LIGLSSLVEDEDGYAMAITYIIYDYESKCNV